MTPTVVDEEDERDEDNISTDVDDDNVQGAGALPNTVSVNLQKSAIIYVDFNFLGWRCDQGIFVITFLFLGQCDTS